jgi:FkbM family methyltransferase
MGYYSIMSSNYGFNSIYAFEPLPKMIFRIEENIKINELNNLIKIIPFALGDANKKITIFEKHNNIGGSSILNNQNFSQSLEVNMITLNQFVDNYSLSHIDVLKIDVEGYEDRVLMPFFRSNNILIYPKLIIIEHSSSNDWNENVIEWMLNNGYSQEFRTRGNTILKLDI